MRQMPPTNQLGFTLMEVMIGLVLGLIVVGGGVSVYLASSRAYQEVEQISQLNESTRFAEQVITDALRHAGFVGEVSPGKITLHSSITSAAAVVDDCTGNAAAYNLAFPIFASVVTSTGTAPDIGDCVDETDAVEDSEILIIKSAVPRPISDGPRNLLIPSTVASHINEVLDYPAPGLLADKIYVLTNNTKGELFDSDVTTHPTIGAGGDVPNGTAWEYRFEVFYIQDFVLNGVPQPRLVRKVLEENGAGEMVLSPVPQVLVTDVEDMRMRFGIDTDADGEVDIYRTVAETEANTDWANVVAMEIAMLVSSQVEDHVGTDQKTYSLLGNPVSPTVGREGYRRLVTRANVSLRNVKFVIRGNVSS